MRMTWRTSAALAAMLAAGGLANAAGAAEPLPESCKGEKPTIGVALPNTVNPYYIAMQDSFQKHGAELGYAVNVAIANDNDSNQLAQIESFIQQGVCAVALNAVNSGPGAASVRALNQAGIPVFTVNVIVSGEDLEAQGASFVQYVGADQVAGGRQMGEQALKDLGADAPMVVGIIGNPDQIPTNQRDQGFSDAIGKNANAKVVQTVNGKVDPNVSLQVAGDMLQVHPDINVLWADTGPHTVGALQAVSQQGKSGSVKVYGFCAADTALDATYAGCAAQTPAEYAAIVLDNMKIYLGGGEVPKEILRPLKAFVSGQKPGPGEVG